MPARPAHLPDPFVGLVPRRLEVLEQVPLERPGVVVRVEAVHARLVEHVHHLAVHVELELLVRRVADPHRPRALVPRQPVELVLGERAARPPSPYMICSCAGSPATARSSQSRHGRASSVIAGVEERVERERRVAQPAVAVVPVPLAADPLRQRRRRRSDDAAGRRVGERLQHDQRTHARRRARRPRSVQPPIHSRQHASVSTSACSASIGRGDLEMRRVPRQDERDAVARRGR